MNVVSKLSKRPLAQGFIIVLLLLGGWSVAGAGHAAAAAPNKCTTQHQIAINVYSYNATTGAQIGGAHVTESRGGVATCPNGPNGNDGTYVDDSGQPGHAANSATTVVGGVNLPDSCWNSSPYVTQTPPSGDTFAKAVVQAYSSSGNGPPPTTLDSNHGTQADFAAAMAKYWTPSLQNMGSGFIIQLYYSVPVHWQLSGGSSVTPSTLATKDPSGATAQFNTYAANTGPDNANYNYQVVKRYNNQSDGYNGSWSNATFAGSSGSESTVPSSGPGSITPSIQNSYSFPSGAKSGDSYCEAKTYTNANGTGTGSGTGSESCVTYSPGSGGCPSSGCPTSVQCTQDVHPMSANSVYRFTLYDSGEGSGYITSGPPSTSGSSRGSWATLAGGDVLQTDQTNSTNSAQPYTLTYPPPTGPDAYVVVERWNDNGGNWTYSNKVEGVSGCYEATCSINFDSTAELDTANAVEAGTTFTVHVTINSIGAQALPASSNNGASLDLTNNGQLGSSPVITDISPTSSPPYHADFTLTAPSTAGAYSLSGYPDYYSQFAIPGPNEGGASSCATTVNVYQPFTMSASASASLLNSVEDPWDVSNTGCMTEGGVPVKQTVTAELYEIPVGSATHISQYSTSSGGPFDAGKTCLVPTKDPDPTKTYPSNTYNYPPMPPFNAGDQYCSEVDVQYASGWADSSGDVAVGANTAGTPDTDCPSIANRPFFKVYGSSVSAGGDFLTANDSCTGGGELAGWNNNTGTNPVSGDFGASAQFSTSAIGDIVGFASAQTAFGRSPTALSFANNGAGVNVTNDAYSPALGGDLGGKRRLTDVNAPTGSTTQTGPYSVPATTVNAGTNQSIFVKGDAYISGNVVYGGTGGGWTLTGANSVPSFVLHATGNIYINPSVTELDGLYIAEGKTYTCSAGTARYADGTMPATAYAPMATNELYANCHNQLMVYGSFVADQVDMMRTFGSLRDEGPTGGTPAIPATLGTPDTPGVTAPLQWSVSIPIVGDTCTNIIEPSDNNWTKSDLCVTKADAGKVRLGWTNAGGTTPAQKTGLGDCTVAWGLAQRGIPKSATWGDDYLCSNVPISIQTTDGSNANQDCTLITQPKKEANWKSMYVCIGTFKSGTPGTPATPATPYSAPNLTSCSNQGIWTDQATCAAEVFQFSPEMYLSTPSIAPPSGGATQYDAITGLPPIL